MVIDLLGIVEDGSNRASQLPKSAVKAIKMVKGSTLLVRMSIVRASGLHVILANDPEATVHLTVKDKARNDEMKLSVAGSLVPAEGVSRVNFSISPAATRFLDPGRYIYDVWLEYDGSRDAVVPVSPFVLEPSLRPV